ncbi:MAG: hypothetical protein JRN20_10280 [Nitrososphaerota archaeon]|nr:hypothetical protein [Nitrososphaerota archaeon]
MSKGDKSKDNLLFSGHGSPALMSLSEPAFELLHERYHETFAITHNRQDQVHLFLIKVGLWSLVWTFTPRDFGSDKIEISDVLERLEVIMKSDNREFLSKLDAAVSGASERIKKKINRFASK